MVYFWFKKCVFILVLLLSTTLLTRAVQFNARSACDASMFTSCIYIFLRLASKCLNCTRSPEEIVQKLHKYDWKHKINALKIDSNNFTELPVTFLVENNNENQVKFAKFFNILLNFSLWLCVVQVAWHNFKRFSRSNDDDKISLAFEISKANEILSLSVERENRLKLCQATWTQNNYIQKGISRRIVSHASLRMLNFLASVMRKFYEETDRKNRIFGRKTDILRKNVARCAILLNIHGKKDCFDVSSYNWAHKHHFIVRKTKKTYLSDCEKSHEKQQTGIFCELKTCFYLPMSG